MAAMMEPDNGTAVGALPEGYRLGGFEIRRLLWRSPATLVYAAHDHSLDVPVAIEEYMPERLAERGEEAHVQPIEAWQSELIERGLRAFVSESRALARCNEAALLKVSQIWQANGTVYRVMPPLEGQTLFERRKSMHTAPDENWLRALALQLLDALQAYHAQVGVHGALSPGHVLIGANDRVLLLGPGAAASVLANELGESPRSDFELAFAAPEMVDAHDAAARGPWSDLYSLGHLLRYCISGEEPVLREPMRALIRRVYGADGALDYSGALIDTLDAAASPIGRDRPSSADDFRARLQRRNAPPAAAPHAAAAVNAPAHTPTHTHSAPQPFSSQPPAHVAVPTLSANLPSGRGPTSAPVPLARSAEPVMAPTPPVVPPAMTPAAARPDPAPLPPPVASWNNGSPMSAHSEDTTIAPILTPGASRKQRRKAEAEAAARAEEAAAARAGGAMPAGLTAPPPAAASPASEPAFDLSRFSVADSSRPGGKIDPSFEPTVLLRPGPAPVPPPPQPPAPQAHTPAPPQAPAQRPAAAPAPAARAGQEPFIANLGTVTRGPGGAADEPSPTAEVDAPAIALLVSQAVEYASARAREAGHPDPASLRAALNIAPVAPQPAVAMPGGYSYTPPSDPVPPPARPAPAPAPAMRGATPMQPPSAPPYAPPRAVPTPAPAQGAGATTVDTSTMAADAAPFATSGFRVQSLGLEPLPAPPPGDPFGPMSTRLPNFGADAAERSVVPPRRGGIRPSVWTAGLLLVIAALAITVIYIVSGAYQTRGPAFALPSPATTGTDTAPATTTTAQVPEATSPLPSETAPQAGATTAPNEGSAVAPVQGSTAAPNQGSPTASVGIPTAATPAPLADAPAVAATTGDGTRPAARAPAPTARSGQSTTQTQNQAASPNPGARTAAARPAPTRPAAEAEPAAPRTEPIREPRQACAGKTQFALYRCMQAVCSEGHWISHPQCVRLRTQDAVD